MTIMIITITNSIVQNLHSEIHISSVVQVIPHFCGT